MAEVRSVARRPLWADRAVGGTGHVKLVHTQADLASVYARQALDGADIVYHLGAQVWEGRGRGSAPAVAMHRANVLGTANVAGADVGVLVLASSVAVYGAWPDNPLPMDESWAPRPNPECPYAQHKRAAEMACAETFEGPWSAVRLCAVLGPHADARVARAVAGYRWVVPAVRGAVQAVQWMDEGDAVSALLAAGRALLSGLGTPGQVFNAAPTEWLSASDISRLAGGRVVQVPRGLLMAGSRAVRGLRLAPFGPDRAVLVNGPLVMSCARAQAVLGWAAALPSSQVLLNALKAGWRSAPRARPLA